jgi:hypothetical protein
VSFFDTQPIEKQSFELRMVTNHRTNIAQLQRIDEQLAELQTASANNKLAIALLLEKLKPACSTHTTKPLSKKDFQYYLKNLQEFKILEKQVQKEILKYQQLRARFLNPSTTPPTISESYSSGIIHTPSISSR